MTNPSNAVGTNAAYNGRTSVNAVNDVLASYSGRGIMSGWAVAPSSGLTVQLGGTDGIRDAAIAEDDNGNRTTINNISGLPIEVTLNEAPEEGSRIDLLVAYVNNPAQVETTNRSVDNPQTCGLITVSGSATATPTAPTESDIRSAITADGASGSTAYFVVLGSVTVGAGVTDITADAVTQGAAAVPGGGGEGAVTETFTITAATWAELADASPYKFSASVTAETAISPAAQVELINNQAVLFANYGFAIAAVSGQNIVFYALKTPEDAVTLTVEIGG